VVSLCPTWEIHTRTNIESRAGNSGIAVEGYPNNRVNPLAERFRHKEILLPWLPCDSSSDEAPADSLKEIFGIGTRPLHNLGIVAVFDFHFLKYKFHSNFRFVSSLYECARTLLESGASIPFRFRFGRREASCGLACVLAKLRSGQSVVSTLSLFSAKQRGHRESPSTVGAGPTIHITLEPDQ